MPCRPLFPHGNAMQATLSSWQCHAGHSFLKATPCRPLVLQGNAMQAARYSRQRHAGRLFLKATPCMPLVTQGNAMQAARSSRQRHAGRSFLNATPCRPLFPQVLTIISSSISCYSAVWDNKIDWNEKNLYLTSTEKSYVDFTEKSADDRVWPIASCCAGQTHLINGNFTQTADNHVGGKIINRNTKLK